MSVLRGEVAYESVTVRSREQGKFTIVHSTGTMVGRWGLAMG